MNHSKLVFIKNNINVLMNSESNANNASYECSLTFVKPIITIDIIILLNELTVLSNISRQSSLFIDYMTIETIKYIIDNKCLEYIKLKKSVNWLSSSVEITENHVEYITYKNSVYSYINEYVNNNISNWQYLNSSIS